MQQRSRRRVSGSVPGSWRFPWIVATTRFSQNARAAGRPGHLLGPPRVRQSSTRLLLLLLLRSTVSSWLPLALRHHRPAPPSSSYTLFTSLFFYSLPSTDKQNELEVPCPVPKSRDRKRRQGQQQQQQGGMMTQISGVRKLSHTSGVSGGSGNRFGVKTDQEELLSKVSWPDYESWKGHKGAAR